MATALEVNVVSPEEASQGVAEIWSGDRLVGFTRVEEGALTLRAEGELAAHARIEILAEAYRVLAIYPAHR